MKPDLFFVSGRDAFDRTTWGCHLWAFDAADARKRAAMLAERDVTHPQCKDFRLTMPARFIARRSKSDASNAMNLYPAQRA